MVTINTYLWARQHAEMQKCSHYHQPHPYSKEYSHNNLLNPWNQPEEDIKRYYTEMKMANIIKKIKDHHIINWRWHNRCYANQKHKTASPTQLSYKIAFCVSLSNCNIFLSPLKRHYISTNARPIRNWLSWPAITV